MSLVGREKQDVEVEPIEQKLGGKTMSAAAIADAQRAALAEHNLGFLAAVKIYKKAVFWSLMVSMVRSIILFLAGL